MSESTRATAAYEDICAYLRSQNLGHERSDERRTVYVTIVGRAFPVAMALHVDEALDRAEVYVELPTVVSEPAAALEAVNRANAKIGNGRFVLRDGKISYEDTLPLLGVEGVGKHLVESAYATVTHAELQ